MEKPIDSIRIIIAMTGAGILNEFRKEIASNVIEDNELN